MAQFTCNFISYALKRATTVSVIVPTMTFPESTGMGLKDGEKLTHQPKGKYPVLYLLHGGGNDFSTWERYTQIELFAEEYNVAVVLLSAEDSAFTTPKHHLFITEELPDFISAHFPVSVRPEDSFIAGLSMGGGGSLYQVLKKPGQYAAIGIFSSGLMRGNYVYDGVPDVDAVKNFFAEGKVFPKAYIACGEEDFNWGYLPKFKDLLIELGADVTWDHLPGYGHEWRFWNIQVEKFLQWIPRSDYYAPFGKRKA